MVYTSEYNILGLVGVVGLVFTFVGVCFFILITRRWVSLGILFVLFYAVFLFVKPLYYSYRKWNADFSFLSGSLLYASGPDLSQLLSEPTLVAVLWLLVFILVYITFALMFTRRVGKWNVKASGAEEGLLRDSILSNNLVFALLELQNVLLLAVNAVIIYYLHSKYGYVPMANKGWVFKHEGFVTLLPLAITGSMLLLLVAYKAQRHTNYITRIRLFAYALGSSLVQMLMGYREGVIALVIGLVMILQLSRQLNLRTIIVWSTAAILLAFSYAIYRQSISQNAKFLEHYSLLDRFTRDLNPYDGYVNAYWYYKSNQLYMGQTVLDLIPFLIPRFMWRDKPSVLGQMKITEDLYPDLARHGIVVTTTLLGELYANWGIGGTMLAAFLLGAVVAWLDTYVRTSKIRRAGAAFVFFYIILTSSVTRLVRTGFFGEGHYLAVLSAIPFLDLMLIAVIFAAAGRNLSRHSSSVLEDPQMLNQGCRSKK